MLNINDSIDHSAPPVRADLNKQGPLFLDLSVDSLLTNIRLQAQYILHKENGHKSSIHSTSCSADVVTLQHKILTDKATPLLSGISRLKALQ